MKSKKNLDFNTVFTAFYQPIADLRSMAGEYRILPDAKTQEFRIRELSALPCSFALLVETETDTIRPVEGCTFPFEADFLTDKQFCRFIHPNYLIPFLVFAKFVYEIGIKTATTIDHLYKVSYKIPVPLKIKGHTGYAWYIQKAFAVSANEKGQIIRHLNLYEFDRMCLTLPNGEIEYRFVEATLLSENNLHDTFQQFMAIKIHDYLHFIFQKQYKQWKMLQALKQDSSLSNRQMASVLNLREETVNSYSKDILYTLRSHLGYQFVSLREAVAALTHKGFI